MSIAGNKASTVYTTNCFDPCSTEISRKSNNANVLTLGSQILGKEFAKALVTIWLQSEYTPGGRSEPKIQRVC